MDFQKEYIIGFGEECIIGLWEEFIIGIRYDESLIGLLGKCVIGLRRTDHSAVRIKKQDKDLSQYSLWQAAYLGL